MPGLGTIINCIGIFAGGLLGLLFGRFIKENIQDALTKVCGVSTLFIAISGALEKMLSLEYFLIDFYPNQPFSIH